MNPLSLHCSQINEVENRFLEIFCWLIWCQVGSGYSCDQNTASAPNILEESSGKHYKKTYFATGKYILPAFCFDHFFGNDLSITLKQSKIKLFVVESGEAISNCVKESILQ